MKINKILLNSFLMLSLTFATSCQKKITENLQPVDPPENAITYTMPSEEVAHEGTWLQWPHKYTWGQNTPNKYDKIWVDMTKALHKGEMVHIVAYDDNERNRITRLLEEVDVDMSKVDFLIEKTEDFWVRDNGPIFVYDKDNNLMITNWIFNGWGGKHDAQKDNQIPSHISNAIGVSKVDVDMVLEGGAIEVDGAGTLMATKSSILNDNRNPGLTQAQAEIFFKHYLGITNFIWLDGIADLDITDMHIDGVARFVGDHTIVTFSKEVAENYGENVVLSDYDVLENAKNAKGKLYAKVRLPIAPKAEGSYMNYYVGNEVVIMPNYNEPTDAVAKAIIQKLYPEREVVSIAVNKLWKDGGAIHCVTQQQPK